MGGLQDAISGVTLQGGATSQMRTAPIECWARRFRRRCCKRCSCDHLFKPPPAGRSLRGTADGPLLPASRPLRRKRDPGLSLCALAFLRSRGQGSRPSENGGPRAPVILGGPPQT